MAILQIRNVPEDVYRKLEARAAEAGLSLSEYALRCLVREAEYPSTEELLKQLRARPVRGLKTTAAEIIREERNARAGDESCDATDRRAPAATG